jgi:hypothetical protein
MAFLPSMLTITKLSGLASIAKEVKTLFLGSDTPVRSNQLAGKSVRDTTKFTDHQIAMIKAEYAVFLIKNQTDPKKRMTQQELAIMLNKKFGLNKSRQSYAKIWNQEE